MDVIAYYLLVINVFRYARFYCTILHISDITVAADGSLQIGDEAFVTIIHLTHCGRMTHICVGEQTIIGSDNGLTPDRRQAIIWTNAGILSTGPLGTNFSEILIETYTFSFKKMHLKMSSAKWRLFRLGLNVLACFYQDRILAVQRLIKMPRTTWSYWTRWLSFTIKQKCFH